MFDKLSIRTKLIAIVAAPLLVTIVLAGLGFTQRRAEAADTRQDVARLEAIQATQRLQHELQLEVLYGVQFLASGADEAPEALLEQQAATDEAADGLEDAIEAVDQDRTAVLASEAALRGVRSLSTSLRPQVNNGSLHWTWAENLYRNSLNAMPPVSNRLVVSIGDRDLAEGAASVVALGEYTTTQARIGVILAGVAADGRFPVAETGPTAAEGEETTETGQSSRNSFEDALELSSTQLAVVSAQSGARVRVLLRNQMVGGDVSYFSDVVYAVSAIPPGGTVSIDSERWTEAVEATLAQLRSIASDEATGVLDAAGERASDADTAARLYLVGAALAVLVAIGLAVYVATSIARPVLSLTRAADKVATEQLPRLVEALRNPNEDDLEHLRPSLEDLDVGGGRELSRLSASVGSIQDMAVNVATEQASLLRKGIGDMFVNLARRNQALLDRQLEYIDELEAQEEDPDQLEHLFRLDHMATRMRRNAESLLVLAGAEPSRRRGNPVPLTKVALAAVGEIEHFARVDLLDVDETEVVSNAAADIAHLLSELMENATQFSPPDSRVEVLGHRNADGGYTVSISDQGIGMSTEQLAEANQLLANPPLLGLTLARTLGFIVVGRLAARHGITVRLVASPGGGVTGIVTLPEALIVSTADRVDLTGPAPGRAVGTPDARGPETVPTPSSILPPFEYSSGPIDDEPLDAPATLAEAVPSGESLDEELSRVSAGDGPVRSVPTGAPEPLPDDLVAPVARTSPLFGPSNRSGGAGPEPLPDAPTSTPKTDTAPPTRLFGTGGPPPAPTDPTPLFRVPSPAPPLDDAPAPSAPEGAPPLARRQPGATAPPVAGPGPAAATPPVAATGPEVTSAGLVKRVPRRAGADRAVPGSDGPARAATTSTRSPDEVRAMLSRFHSGKQRAGQEPPASSPSDTDHKEP